MPYYAIDDQFPYGHGEKSVFLIERKMHLKIDEAMAIRWHMGEFGDKNSNSISLAYERYPLAVKPVSYTHLDVYKRQEQNILCGQCDYMLRR